MRQYQAPPSVQLNFDAAPTELHYYAGREETSFSPPPSVRKEFGESKVIDVALPGFNPPDDFTVSIPAAVVALRKAGEKIAKAKMERSQHAEIAFVASDVVATVERFADFVDAVLGCDPGEKVQRIVLGGGG